MRTTIDINDELFRWIKRRAADEGITMRELIEQSIRMLLKTRKPESKTYTLQWRTELGKLQPGVQLDNRDALFDLMDGRE